MKARKKEVAIVIVKASEIEVVNPKNFEDAGFARYLSGFREQKVHAKFFEGIIEKVLQGIIGRWIDEIKVAADKTIELVILFLRFIFLLGCLDLYVFGKEDFNVWTRCLEDSYV